MSRNVGWALFSSLLGIAICGAQAHAQGFPLLSPGDPIFAIDLDESGSASSYPAAEAPANVLDGDPATKYLNFAGANSGLIVTPQVAASTVQSLQLTTANDAPARDPASFELYGTNDPITSEDNSTGLEEDWSLIASGPLSLPDERLTAGSVVPFTNSTAYDSYRLMFPTLKGGPLMQIGDVALFETSDGSGANILAPGDFTIAVHNAPNSRYPVNEPPSALVDNDPGTKYLNFGELNSGFIVSPAVSPSIVTGFQITTANDAPERDPTMWELYGTNDPIMSDDNSRAMEESWTLIDSGDVSLPDQRLTLGPLVPVDSDAEFTSYRFVVTGVKDAEAANSVQFAEIQFFGVPEPSSVVLLLLSGVSFVLWGSRQRAA